MGTGDSCVTILPEYWFPTDIAKCHSLQRPGSHRTLPGTQITQHRLLGRIWIILASRAQSHFLQPQISAWGQLSHFYEFKEEEEEDEDENPASYFYKRGCMKKLQQLLPDHIMGSKNSPACLTMEGETSENTAGSDPHSGSQYNFPHHWSR